MLVANFTRSNEEIELEELWQYDYGQKLQINGLNLPDIFEVHFFWKELEKAKIVTGYTQKGTSYVDIPDEGLKQKRAITAYIYLSTPEEGKTVNTVTMYVSKRPAPENLEIPEKVDLFHYTLTATAEYQKQAAEARQQAIASSEESEAWAHGRKDYPAQEQDNARYYANQAAKYVEEVTGRAEQAKKNIDIYVQEKEKNLKGDTGNVFFAAFKVIRGRLKMYSDSNIDKVNFQRSGSRLKYRLKV